MKEHRKRRGRRALLAAVVVVVTGAVLAPVASPAFAAETAWRDPVRSLQQAAYPLRSTEPGRNTADLRALGGMIGGAKVVGLGEATHGSHEFFTMKERVFRYLVEEKGFRAFALELSWSAGLEIDEYVQTGKGDVRELAKRTLAGSPWDREEFVDLIRWMRDHNRAHPGRTVHFVGDDLGAPSVNDAFFARITGHVRQHHPAHSSELDRLYTGLRPIDDAFAYLRKPLAERQRLATQAEQAYELVKGLAGAPEHDWAEQHARFVAQTARFLAVDVADPESLPTAQILRDRAMAENVAWWHRKTGHKILLSAHNGHVSYVTDNPKLYPKTQGAFLRETLGRAYLPIGFSFDRGSFLSKDKALGGDWRRFSVPAAPSGSNEHTLDQVRFEDFYLDVRTAQPPARAWLDVARPTRTIGTLFPVDPAAISLGRSYDVVIHLHDVRQADLRR
ncbi:erythromycin esterase [Amycolatopsis sp. WAC 01375]|uniref:erythromycin esterase family protein n=1 Tax=Amycolatopsis sp. WAC 01375 TaxID=2203194 RepID=UPI000F797EE4|nr:erythromycin esterase family protein [Amycolatopsis sp. WAC 01375]RSM68510.1 erythromycin esterase [Amycolatopsis sp. WAC 01375]